MGGAHDEVGRPAETGVDPALHPARIRLIEEVNLQRRVHARHPGLTREPKMKDAISGTSSSSAPPSDTSSTPSLNISVQMRSPLLWVSGQDGVGDCPDAELQGGIRLDERHDPVANRSFDIAKIAPLVRRERLVYLDEIVDLMLIVLRIAVGIGHLHIGLNDDEAAMRPRRRDGRRQDIDLGAEAHGV